MSVQNQRLQSSSQTAEIQIDSSDLRPECFRRLEIMVRAEMGQSLGEICAALRCSHETARYWMAMAQTGQTNTWRNHPRGRPKMVNDDYLERLKKLVEHSPKQYGYPFKQWTAHVLNAHLAKELGITVSDRHINRLLRQMGLSTRLKHKNTIKENTPPEDKGAGIKIDDLQPSSLTEPLWLFNFGNAN